METSAALSLAGLNLRRILDSANLNVERPVEPFFEASSTQRRQNFGKTYPEGIDMVRRLLAMLPCMKENHDRLATLVRLIQTADSPESREEELIKLIETHVSVLLHGHEEDLDLFNFAGITANSISLKFASGHRTFIPGECYIFLVDAWNCQLFVTPNATLDLDNSSLWFRCNQVDDIVAKEHKLALESSEMSRQNAFLIARTIGRVIKKHSFLPCIQFLKHQIACSLVSQDGLLIGVIDALREDGHHLDLTDEITNLIMVRAALNDYVTRGDDNTETPLGPRRQVVTEVALEFGKKFTRLLLSYADQNPPSTRQLMFRTSFMWSLGMFLSLQNPKQAFFIKAVLSENASQVVVMRQTHSFLGVVYFPELLDILNATGSAIENDDSRLESEEGNTNSAKTI